MLYLVWQERKPKILGGKMKEEDKETYTDIIERWSKIYKSRIGNLFTLEELKQEAWLSILKAEEYAERVAVDKEAFLASCVKNSLLKLLLNEIEHRTTYISNLQKVDTTTPEEIISSNEIYKKLQISIKKIPDAEFILPYINIKTVREISDIAKSEGHPMSKSYVHKVISLIRGELDKIMRG
jgi:DNA-directed RNA polymerase specialized sigma24 family protein